MVREWCGMGRWLSVSFRVGGTRLERMGRAWHAHKRCGALGGDACRATGWLVGGARPMGRMGLRPMRVRSTAGHAGQGEGAQGVCGARSRGAGFEAP